MWNHPEDINHDSLFSIICPYQTVIRNGNPYIIMDRDNIIRQIRNRIIYLTKPTNRWIRLHKSVHNINQYNIPHIIIEQQGRTGLVYPLLNNNNNSKGYTIRILGSVYGASQDIIILDIIPHLDHSLFQDRDISFNLIYNHYDPLTVSTLFQDITNRCSINIQNDELNKIHDLIIQYPNYDQHELYRKYLNDRSIWDKIWIKSINFSTWTEVHDLWDKSVDI